jgi:hypothetical protein
MTELRSFGKENMADTNGMWVLTRERVPPERTDLHVVCAGPELPPRGAYDLIRSTGKLVDGNWQVRDPRARQVLAWLDTKKAVSAVEAARVPLPDEL